MTATSRALDLTAIAPPVGWTVSHVDVERPWGRQRAPAFVSATVPGLAITATVGNDTAHGSYSITHVASGLKLPFVYKSLKAALLGVERVRGLADWTLSRDSLAQLEGLQQRVELALAAQSVVRGTPT